MAELAIQGSDLVLSLSSFEKMEAIHQDLRVPVSSVGSVEVIDDPLDAVHGIRSGTGIPGVLVIGTIRYRGGKAFVVIHHDSARGIRVRLHDADYSDVILGCDDPESLAASLNATLVAI
ncbi:MAG: hypothetical protein ABI400_13315 [Lacisediminihabitans sp.]